MEAEAALEAPAAAAVVSFAAADAAVVAAAAPEAAAAPLVAAPEAAADAPDAAAVAPEAPDTASISAWRVELKVPVRPVILNHERCELARSYESDGNDTYVKVAEKASWLV